ncbi:unnamed protein product [Polarella glacialis]|uniref:Uncharacterized protein n=1 Tax=Polarella glacialis TaxID=89957 RepID=A0A813I9L8_POLGL|nr:unnamed protein product [Polarella glacialis]
MLCAARDPWMQMGALNSCRPQRGLRAMARDAFSASSLPCYMAYCKLRNVNSYGLAAAAFEQGGLFRDALALLAEVEQRTVERRCYVE